MVQRTAACCFVVSVCELGATRSRGRLYQTKRGAGHPANACPRDRQSSCLRSSSSSLTYSTFDLGEADMRGSASASLLFHQVVTKRTVVYMLISCFDD